MFRLAVETGEDGAVTRVVFLALRGEEAGQSPEGVRDSRSL
jgi:hypothetical protein